MFVEKSYGKSDCTGRADGAPCAYYAGYVDADCNDGVWCGCSQSYCVAEVCGSPRNTACQFGNCYQTCYADSSSEITPAPELCLTKKQGSCLNKNTGEPCAYDEVESVCAWNACTD